LQCPHPTAPRFQPNPVASWERRDQDLAREPRPLVDFGFAKRWKKSTLSPRDREPSSTKILLKHVPCRVDEDTLPLQQTAAGAKSIGGIRDTVMEEMTTKRSKPSRRVQSGGKFFQTRSRIRPEAGGARRASRGSLSGKNTRTEGNLGIFGRPRKILWQLPQTPF
jgi:hypothetical protein